MRSSIKLSLIALVAASLAACSDRDTLPTGPQPRTASKDFGGPIFIDPNRFVAITAGDEFTCAVQNSGNVYCWGRADRAQPGGTARGTCFNEPKRAPCIPRPTLVRNVDATPFLARTVDAGGSHACAIERPAPNRVFCWGAGGDGQLGQNGTYPPAGAVLPIPGTDNASLVSAGTMSSCAQKPDGVFCWGRLTHSGTTPNVSAPAPWAGAFYVDLSVGENHACAVEAGDGLVVCWGRNDNGQAANTWSTADNLAGPMPTLFPRPSLRVVTQDNTTCVEISGAMPQCAGRNFSGQFGNNTSGNSTATPQSLVAGGPLYNITVGANHSCGLDANGAAFCWGLGKSGQLGNGQSLSSLTPVPVSGGHTYTAIAAGGTHTCAIGADNVIYCWGNNFNGQLGAWVPLQRTPVPTDPLAQY